MQKVLSSYTSELRAVFLHYAQLDASFAEHWPPSLAFSQWMLFCKDSQTSGANEGNGQVGVPGFGLPPWGVIEGSRSSIK